MKKHIVCLSILLFLFYSSGYSQDLGIKMELPISGVWRLNFDRQKSEITLSRSESLTALATEQEESLDQTLLSRIYMFFEDGSFELQWTSRGQFMAVKGTYSIERDNLLRLATKESTLDYMVTMEEKSMMLNPVRKTEGITDVLHLKKIE
ncbi:hypothetical protein [Cecembia calidifontis]|uniref:Lipocalin-like protein n=1 Tax=Cecembia calidifontis TaxID=1187080 RepID=A0A4Q7PCD0_9BACT|nr:hypothetical protein [Cecembia calidifontis]RZS98013.1 hypothetical protein BC751_3642 [Cecembia calidifontis]